MSLMNFKMLVLIGLCLVLEANGLTHLNDLAHYKIVEPVQINKRTRHKRDLSTEDENAIHYQETTFEIDGIKRKYIVHIQKNSILIPRNFKVISQDETGKTVINKAKRAKNCYYHGYIQGEDDSMVTMTTCKGLRGLLRTQTGDNYFIEPLYQNASKHVMYNLKDLKLQEARCGHDDHSTFTDKTINDFDMLSIPEHHSRNRRSSNLWTYLETVLVVDNKQHVSWGNSLETSEQKGAELMNYVDTAYKLLNVRIALTSVIVWTTKDAITMSSTVGVTYANFKDYVLNVIRNQMGLIHDNAQLITGAAFSGNVVGLGGVGTICSPGSAAVTQVYTTNAAVAANTIIHEMGHNFGFDHYNSIAGCVCSTQPCPMNSGAPGTQVQGWASCTIKTFEERTNASRYLCMSDLPEKLFTGKECGNGYLEDGEECDCGTESDCKRAGADKCCDFSTCKLQSGSQCAIGACCDDCKFLKRGTICRNVQNKECDLEEFCTGETANCPRNVYTETGSTCQNGTGLCYSGLCRDDSGQTEQCETLWGENGARSLDVCFNVNKNGNKYGNCGKKDDGTFIQCSDRDQLCGKIQCTSKPGTSVPRFPLLGTNRRIKIAYYSVNGQTVSCRAIRMDYPENLDDPTMTFDGTKCDADSVCVNNRCVNISTSLSQKSCDPGLCKNGGVCNSNGNCHCPKGWACPYCDKPGVGGSVDSGQGCGVEDKTTSSSEIQYAYLTLLILPVTLMVIVAVLYVKGISIASLFTSSNGHKGRIGSMPTSQPPTVQYENNNIKSVGETTISNPYATAT